jgi:hypothetical protein
MNPQLLSTTLLLGMVLLGLDWPAVAQDGAKLADQLIHLQDAGTVAGCGTSSGTRFNLKARPHAKAQHTTSVDVLRNRMAAGVDLVVGSAVDGRGLGGNGSVYYGSRDAECAPAFEGASR